MTSSPSKPPFDSHRRYYLILKIAVLVIVALLALRYLLSQPFAP
jgi:hypothetical protein